MSAAATIFELRRDAFGRLVLTDAQGAEHVGVLAVRAFPIHAADEGIALVDGDGHELAWVPCLDQLDEPRRALLINPRILILDEATASVDTETEREIQKALDNLVRGRTTIAIAHRLSTLRKADRLVVMDKGLKVEEGTHEQLIAQRGAYWRLYEAQARQEKAERDRMLEIDGPTLATDAPPAPVPAQPHIDREAEVEASLKEQRP